MSRYIDLIEFAERIKKNIKPDNIEEKALIDWCKDECIRQGYAMPTADVVEVRHARWVEDEHTYCGAGRCNYRCTACSEMLTAARRETTKHLFPYCPFCGAKMEGTKR